MQTMLGQSMAANRNLIANGPAIAISPSRMVSQDMDQAPGSPRQADAKLLPLSNVHALSALHQHLLAGGTTGTGSRSGAPRSNSMEVPSQQSRGAGKADGPTTSTVEPHSVTSTTVMPDSPAPAYIAGSAGPTEHNLHQM